MEGVNGQEYREVSMVRSIEMYQWSRVYGFVICQEYGEVLIVSSIIKEYIERCKWLGVFRGVKDWVCREVSRDQSVKRFQPRANGLQYREEFIDELFWVLHCIWNKTKKNYITIKIEMR